MEIAQDVRDFALDDVRWYKGSCRVLASTSLLDLSNVRILGNSVGVPFCGIDDKQIGVVTFETINGNIFANVAMDYNCPERLDIESMPVYVEVDWMIIGRVSLNDSYDKVQIFEIAALSAKLSFNQTTQEATPIAPQP